MTTDFPASEESLAARWIGDGRPLLVACAGALIFAGGFVVFLALTRELLPHDVHYLGMTAEDLCRAECRILDFMVHDRASFGGSLVGVGILYLWLVTFPLARGERWAWWTLVASGTVGFLTFLSYLGYGYLDTWHGIGTVLLLPVFVAGLILTRRSGVIQVPSSQAQVTALREWRNPLQLGRLILLIGALGTLVGGVIILSIGVSHVFVPEDLHFIGRGAEDLAEISPKLIPLIAHDRAGFGGAVATMGFTTFLSLSFARPSRSLFEVIGLAGSVSLLAAFAIHFAVGYDDAWHLAPPAAAALSLMIGEALAYPKIRRSGG